GQINVNGGGLLTGAGNPQGRIELKDGGTLSPGDNGPAQFNPSRLVVDGGNIEFQLGAPVTGTTGPFISGASDRLFMSGLGARPTGAGGVITINALSGFDVGTYTLMYGWTGGVATGSYIVNTNLTGYNF